MTTPSSILAWRIPWTDSDMTKRLTLWGGKNPLTVAQKAPLSMVFFRREYRTGLPCPSPGDLPDPGIEPSSLSSPALAGGFFTTSTTWEANYSFHIYRLCPKSNFFSVSLSAPWTKGSLKINKWILCGESLLFPSDIPGAWNAGKIKLKRVFPDSPRPPFPQPHLHPKYHSTPRPHGFNSSKPHLIFHATDKRLGTRTDSMH